MKGKRQQSLRFHFPNLKKKWFPCNKSCTQEKAILRFKELNFENLVNVIIEDHNNVPMEVDSMENDFFGFWRGP